MKKRIVAIMSTAVLLLSGCGSSFPQLSDEEAKAVGEYAAITLLKYDANSRSRLVDLSQVEDEPETEGNQGIVTIPEEVVPEEPKVEESQTPEIQESVADVDTDMVAESIEEFLELPEGISVAFTGYELCQSYQEEGSLYFTLEASSGKTLLVTKFVMQNSSPEAKQIDLLQRKDNYRITVNGTYSRTALTTMLSNDMTTYKGSLAVGALQEVVLVIEVDSEMAQDVQSISLNLKNESKIYTIQVL